MVTLHQDPNAFQQLDPEQAPQVVERYRTWFDEIRGSGRYVVSDKLMDEGGKVVDALDGSVSVVDGPYTEVKEVVGGYLTLRAGSYGEVLELLRDCPHLAFGRLEVRQTDPIGYGEEYVSP
jgi:hypothetical protein